MFTKVIVEFNYIQQNCLIVIRCILMFNNIGYTNQNVKSANIRRNNGTYIYLC